MIPARVRYGWELAIAGCVFCAASVGIALSSLPDRLAITGGAAAGIVGLVCVFLSKRLLRRYR